MAMVIKDNAQAGMILGELNKNTKSRDKAASRLAAGQRIIGAGDGASEFAISEKMRVRIRALEQNEANVQNGAALLNVAEGAVANQVELMRTIKERVINANNDHNTDIDRQTIQKEIDQAYDEIEDIAVDTRYNDMQLLTGGNFIEKRVMSWAALDEPVTVPDSDALNMIPDTYPGTYNGVEGPFDKFTAYSKAADSLLGISGTTTLSGSMPATSGVKRIVEVDFSVYTDVPSLVNTGIQLTDDGTYVFTDGTSDLPSGINQVDISNCSTVDEAVSKLATAIGSRASAANGKLQVTSSSDGASGRQFSVVPYSYTGATKTAAVAYRQGAAGTGLSSLPLSLSGGTNEQRIYSPSTTKTETYTYTETTPPSAPGESATVVTKTGTRTVTVPGELLRTIPGTKASASIDVSSVNDGTGLTVNGSGTTYLKFASGYSTPVLQNGVYVIDKTATASWTSGGISFSLDGGKLTMTATAIGTYGNSYGAIDGVTEVQAQPAVYYTSVTGNKAPVTVVQEATDGTPGIPDHVDIDMSSLDSTDSAALEAFISQLVNGKTHTRLYYPSDTATPMEFYDSGAANPLAQSAYQAVSGLNIVSSTGIDLNDLRQSVASGSTIAEAFASLMQSANSYFSLVTDSTGKLTGLRLNAPSYSSTGTLTVTKETPYYYDIDMSSVITGKSPADLNGEGFRFYCATDEGQWFNISFFDSDDMGEGFSLEAKPKGKSGVDLQTIYIDVANVTDGASLAKAIYDQGKTAMLNRNHNYFFSYNPEEPSKLTIYDKRLVDLSKYAAYQQPLGAKIADGVIDDVILLERDVRTKHLIIQDTDKASMNTVINIPQTSLDHIFEFIPGNRDISEFNVNTREMRENLLGKAESPGILDKGIEYLLSAQTLIGAEHSRLDYDASNIITAREMSQAAESTIRDADMAKTMVQYTKSSILSQVAQSMLAQANQGSSDILNLLQ